MGWGNIHGTEGEIKVWESGMERKGRRERERERVASNQALSLLVWNSLYMSLWKINGGR